VNKYVCVDIFTDERPPGVICTCNESTAIGGDVCAGQCEES
jgi:hypothetical protein